MNLATRIERALGARSYLNDNWPEAEFNKTQADRDFISSKYLAYREKLAFSEAFERARLDWLYMVLGDHGYQEW